MTFRKGEDAFKKSADHKTFGIHCTDWGNQIEVHGDEALRNRILRLLTEDEAREADAALVERAMTGAPAHGDAS